jgi:predicted ATPase/DNA-binding winged helix-turn-helix (wHTH) protein
MTASAHHAVLFGPFRLLVRERALFDDDKPVRLGSRAMEVLVALVERAGELVTKRDLIRIVWPDTVVVEANLAVHIAGLRRALGEGQTANRYIINVPGRGYRFVAPVTVIDSEALRDRIGVTATFRQHNLPPHSTRLIGREQIVEELQRRCLAERLVTIAGPGGIGKTAVALAAADRMLPHFKHGVWLIDLSRTMEPRLVPLAAASALQLEIRSDNPLLGLAGVLRDKDMLLVLDNCEHVVEEAAAMANGLLRGVRGIRILATSREALRTEGEVVYRLPELASPPASLPRICAATALSFPAVQLFVERVASIVSDFELRDEDAAHASRICRELDGIPLAIEFAAARADTFSIAGIAAALDDRMRLLAGGNQRPAEARHRTIRSTLDWSYQLLTETERRVLRSVAIFSAGFDLNSASAVMSDDGLDAIDVADAIASLAMKSLLVADIGNSEVRFRLLQTTRIFALAKLSETSAGAPLRRRHAIYYRDLLERLRAGIGTLGAEPLALEIDNIRDALAWAHGPEGERSLAISLTAASAFAWFELALLEECRRWMVKAIDVLHDSERGGSLELELQSALGLSARFSGSMDIRIKYALRRAIELAEKLGEHDRQLQALSALIWFNHRALDLEGALEIAHRAQEIADLLGDPGAHNTSDTMLVLSHFFAGDFETATFIAERVQSRNVRIADKTQIRRWRMDDPIYTKCIMAQIRWTMGFPEQAARIVRDTIREAEEIGLPVLVCLVKTWCANILFHTSDKDSSRVFLSELKETSAALGLPMYEATALCLEGLANAAGGELAAGERLLRRGLDQLLQLRNEASYMAYLSSFAELLEAAGRADEGLILATEALALAKGGWWTPQVMRIKAKLLMSAGADLNDAERLLLGSIDLAHQRSALLFELRSAIDLSRLHRQQGRPGDAGERVKVVYFRFTEGFSTPDLIRARTFIENITRSAS